MTIIGSSAISRNANIFSIHLSLIIISNRYACISIPIFDLRLIRANFSDLRLYEHEAMAISVLRFSSHTVNNNTVIGISIISQVIIYFRDISIFYVRRVYYLIWYMWLQHNRDYELICVICDIQSCSFQFTRYAQIIFIFLYLEFVWVW